MIFDDLSATVQNLLETRRPIIVAISGFGGSGKTTLAEKLKGQFPDSALLQLDNFLINHGGGRGWQSGYDWARFEGVLKDIRAGKDLHYRWYNWEKNETKDWINQPLPSLVIVEGVRILQPNLKQYYDLSVWIDRSIEESTNQGKTRDRANKSDDKYDIEAHIRMWDEVWAPKEKEFVTLFNPHGSADVLYKGKD